MMKINLDPKDKGGKGERAWDRGWMKICKHDVIFWRGISCCMLNSLRVGL